VTTLDCLKIQLFADGADLATMLDLYRNPLIKGFTTNPTLFRRAGVTDYEQFARKALAAIPDRPLSIEVLADDLGEIEAQARYISAWAPNVIVKIPVTNTKGESCGALVSRLSEAGVRLNVTAITTLPQVRHMAECIRGAQTSYISVFAGRIADTGVDPAPVMAEAVRIMAPRPNLELIWASPRELLNIMQADSIGCHVITVTPDLLHKLKLVGKDLDEYSLETVKMFFNDAQQAGFCLSCPGMPGHGVAGPPPLDRSQQGAAFPPVCSL
jgi:transaldolase